eukprot:gb/GECH01006343.1/.p1 GENE.gb/GECH01006343.1/~~gb/GECH01006343.1/.p1  ORF type:complete len:453 (+),score=59.18 gb/GECH01006343.1/:1-1359(+)
MSSQYQSIDDIQKSTISFETLKTRNGRWSTKVHRCTKGYLTGGFGHRLDENSGYSVGDIIPEKLAWKWFNQDFKMAKAAAQKLAPDAPISVQQALTDMCFNMGQGKVSKFKKMLHAINKGDYDRAAREMLDSKYAGFIGSEKPEVQQERIEKNYQRIKDGSKFKQSSVPFSSINSAQSRQFVSYLVQPGDTISGLAKRCGLSQKTLLSYNPKLKNNPNRLRAYDKIRLPPGAELPAEQSSFIPPSQEIHVVQPGEHLTGIAKGYGTSIQRVADSNPQIKDKNLIRPGEKVSVPVSCPYASCSGSVVGGTSSLVEECGEAIIEGRSPKGGTVATSAVAGGLFAGAQQYSETIGTATGVVGAVCKGYSAVKGDIERKDRDKGQKAFAAVARTGVVAHQTAMTSALGGAASSAAVTACAATGPVGWIIGGLAFGATSLALNQGFYKHFHKSIDEI